jgi:hypothetical protein
MLWRKGMRTNGKVPVIDPTFVYRTRIKGLREDHAQLKY